MYDMSKHTVKPGLELRVGIIYILRSVTRVHQGGRCPSSLCALTASSSGRDIQGEKWFHVPAVAGTTVVSRLCEAIRMTPIV